MINLLQDVHVPIYSAPKIILFHEEELALLFSFSIPFHHIFPYFSLIAMSIEKSRTPIYVQSLLVVFFRSPKFLVESLNVPPVLPKKMNQVDYIFFNSYFHFKSPCKCCSCRLNEFSRFSVTWHS